MLLKIPQLRSDCHLFAFLCFSLNAKIPIAISFLLAVKIKDAHAIDGNLQLFNNVPEAQSLKRKEIRGY